MLFSKNGTHIFILGLSDFQYLPLVPEGDPAGEEKDTPLEYIYDKIFPDQLPDMKWLR